MVSWYEGFFALGNGVASITVPTRISTFSKSFHEIFIIYKLPAKLKRAGEN
jgi:hypothetical protein